jgi:hypothetical protein
MLDACVLRYCFVATFSPGEMGGVFGTNRKIVPSGNVPLKVNILANETHTQAFRGTPIRNLES